MKSIITLLQRYLFIMGERKLVLISLVLAFLFVSLLDVAGVFSLGLFISLLAKPETIESMETVNAIRAFLGLEDLNKFIIAVGLLSFFVFMFKTAIACLIQYRVMLFNIGKRIELQKSIFRAYMQAPYAFMLNRNFSHMFYHISQLTTVFVGMFSTSLINLVGNVILVSIFAVFLMIESFWGTVIVFVLFGGPGALYYFVIKDRAAQYGKRASDSTMEANKVVREAISSLNETRILGCEKFFSDELGKRCEGIHFNSARSGALSLVPRPLAEVVLITFIVFFTLIYFVFFGDVTEISRTLGIFGFSGLRMVPAISTILACLQGLKGHTFCTHDLYNEIRAIEKMQEGMQSNTKDETQAQENTEALTFNQTISLQNLSFRYPEKEEDVIQNLNLDIKKGTTIALVGKSGSGKSTLMNLLLGQLIPSSGTISVDGQSVNKNIRAWHKLISYLPQSIYILDDSVTRNVAFGVPEDEIDMEQVKWAVKEAQLHDLIEELPNGLDTPLGDEGDRISGGQRQRIGIARALYHQREILIMDEATSALDEETEAQVKESIARLKGKLTVIMITHHLYDPETFDHIYRLNSGKLVDEKNASS